MITDEVDRLGGVGLGIECGQKTDPQSVDRAVTASMNILSGLDVIDGWEERTITPSRRIVRIKEIVCADSDDFEFVRAFASFDLVGAWEVFAHRGVFPQSRPEAFIMIMPSRQVLNAGEEAFAIGIVEDDTA